MLAYNTEKQGQEVRLSCSDGRGLVSGKWEDIAGFLLMPCDMALVFNVDRFVDVIVSTLPLNEQERIKSGGRIYSHDNRKLYYQPNRMFGINQVDFYGLSRYSDKEIINVNELAELASRVGEAYKYFGITPTRLPSPVAVFSEVLDNLDFPRACDLPDSALPMLNKCAEVAWEEWREVFRIGLWQSNEVTDYDLTAAYPHFISLLPDLRDAKFFTSKTMPDRYSWGLLEGTLNLVKDVTPFYFVGEFPALITTGHLRLINKYQWGEFKMDNGWYFSVSKGYRTPFKDTMLTLYQARQNENPLIKNIAKSISVGIGGKFVQRYQDGRLGDNFNSIYGKMITSACQCEVAEFIWSRGLQDRTISILVDGCLVEGERLSYFGFGASGDGMGVWRANPPSAFLVASLLYQWGNDKRPNKQTYNEVMESIRAKSKSSIIGGNVDLNLLEYDREFTQRPRCGGDLLTKRYSSKPQQKQVQAVS